MKFTKTCDSREKEKQNVRNALPNDSGKSSRNIVIDAKAACNVIPGGDPNSDFIVEDDGNVLLARQLDWETRREYNLTISVTDGVYTTATQLFVSVKDINEHTPRFSRDLYEVNVTENAEIGSPVVRLSATDDDGDPGLLYRLHSARHVSSMDSFAVDYQSGVVSVLQPLDRYNTIIIITAGFFLKRSSG